jgi:hypothetical protein
MGAMGRRHVDPAFRAETMVRQIAEVYETLLARYPERITRFERHEGQGAARGGTEITESKSRA